MNALTQLKDEEKDFFEAVKDFAQGSAALVAKMDQEGAMDPSIRQNSLKWV